MKKRIIGILFVLALSIGLLTGCGGKKLNIVADGVSEYVIVRAKVSTATEINAATELQAYLEKITGVKLEIVKDDTEPTEKEIVIGKTNRETEKQFDREKLGEEGFVIQTTEDKLWFVGGGDRGTIYSVYTFLEDYLGCRFYTSTIEKVPEQKNLSIKAIKKDEQIPTLFYRGYSSNEALDKNYSVKRKYNAAIWGRTLNADVGSGITFAKGCGGHTFAAFVNPEEYFESHPEYFSMNEKGVRVPDTQICLTNPDVLELTIKGVRAWLEAEPNASIISVSPNDCGGSCLCEDCKKVYEEEGGAFSGALIRFVNAVAEDIKEDYPDVWVHTYAYSYTRSAPTKVKPVDNVLVCLATMGTCFSHDIEDATCKDGEGGVTYMDGSNNTFTEDIEAWSKICDNVYIYDYANDFAYQATTFPDFEHLRNNIQFYVKNNAIGIEVEGNARNANVEFTELRAYLLSKLMWNPDMSEDEYYEHMDDFLTGVYGPGGTYIREYVDLSDEVTDGRHFALVEQVSVMYSMPRVTVHEEDELPEDLTVNMVKNYKKTDWTKYWNWYNDVKENRITSEGEELFEKALEMAETEEQTAQLEKIYCQVKHIKSYYYYRRINVADGDLTDLIKAFIKENQGKFTKAEQTSLPNAIQREALSQMEKDYFEYNEEFCKDVVNAGITYLNGDLAKWQEFDFSLPPSMWVGSHR